MKKLLVLSLAAFSLVQRPAPAQVVDRFLRGDANGDGHVALSDAITTLNALFVKSVPLSCEDAADSNDDGRLNLGDAVYTLQWLYRGGPNPPAPGASTCGDDPTADSLLPCVAPFCRSGGGTNDEVTSISISLSEDRLDETGDALANGRVAEALAMVLNSAGDSIAVSVKVKASVAIIALLNVGGEVSFEAKMTRTEDGFYEVSIARDTALTAGVEIEEGLEVNGGNNVGVKAIFRFQSIEEIARTFEQIGTALILNPARGVAVQVLQHTADLLVSIDGMMGQAAQLNGLLEGVKQQIAQLQATVGQLDNAINGAQSELSSVLDKLADILGDIIGVFNKDLKRKLEARKAELEASIASWNRQRSALFQQIATAQAWKAQYESAIAQLAAGIAGARAAVEAARNDVDLARRAIDALDFAQSDLKFHGAAFELTFSRKGDLEAELSPFPGVSIEGASLGASVDTSMGITGRLDLGNDGKPSKFTLTLAGQFGLEVKASLGVGFEGDVKAGVEVALVFKKDNGWYKKVDAKATLTVDAEVLSSVGAGVAVRGGAGRKMSIGMDLVQLYDRRDAVSSFFTSGDVDGLVRAFESLTATIKIEDRWIAQAEFGAGFSIAGDGGKIGGNATWNDVNSTFVANVRAGAVLEQLTDVAKLRSLLQNLVNQVVPVSP